MVHVATTRSTLQVSAGETSATPPPLLVLVLLLSLCPSSPLPPPSLLLLLLLLVVLGGCSRALAAAAAALALAMRLVRGWISSSVSASDSHTEHRAKGCGPRPMLSAGELQESW